MADNANKARQECERLYAQYLVDKNRSKGAEGGRIVREGTDKFAKNYVLPAIKTAASFTPVGPVVGGMDAFYSYKQGDRPSAYLSTASEVVPMFGKGMYKLASVMAKNISNPAQYLNMARKEIKYNGIRPVKF